MRTQDLDLIVGALDSLGVALAEHKHEWTEGERTIYEEAIKTLWTQWNNVNQWQIGEAHEMARHYKRERDEARNNAEALAEALRGILAAYKAVREKPLRIVALVDAAEEALARWEVK